MPPPRIKAEDGISPWGMSSKMLIHAPGIDLGLKMILKSVGILLFEGGVIYLAVSLWWTVMISDLLL